MGNSNLHRAKKAKNDEFYTLYEDIEKEVEHYYNYNKNVFRGKTILLPCDNPEHSNFTLYFFNNFERFGIKKLISTSYAEGAFADIFNLHKVEREGRVFIYEGKEKLDKPTWDFLNGDGDFRSDEVTKLRDEADIIITNPPFSLFREFLAWIVEANKEFLIIANKNAITYKEVFPLIKENRLWAGVTSFNKDMLFIPPEVIDPSALPDSSTRVVDGVAYMRSPSIWITSLDHGRRHQPLPLMSMEDNIKYNSKLKGEDYQKYDNYDAIEVPYTDAIPSDYDGVMGVPITFLAKFNPKQFEILGVAKTPICFSNDAGAKRKKVYKNAVQYKNNKIVGGGNKVNDGPVILLKEMPKNKTYYLAENENIYLIGLYDRILIKHKGAEQQ